MSRCLDAARREVREKTGMEVEIERLVGLYSVLESRDLMAFVTARIESRQARPPDEEIAEIAFFSPGDLPTPIHPCILQCLDDALADIAGVVRVLNSGGTVKESLASG